MNKKITLSAIDTQITPIIHAIQYDTDRQLECYFDDIDITGVTAARLYALKPDNTEVYTDCTLANGYIVAPLDSQTLAVVGTVNCQIQLTINGTLTTFLFNVIVDKSLVASSAIPSSNEYTALETLIDEAQDVIDGLPSKVSKAGDSMSGNLDMTDNKIVNLGAPTADADAANKEYVDDSIDGITYDNALSDTSENAVQNKVVKAAIDAVDLTAGGTINGALTVIGAVDVLGNSNFHEYSLGDVGYMAIANNGNGINANGRTVTGIPTPQNNDEAANKKYVDDADALDEKLANKVTGVLDNTATDTQYPSAKSVMDTLLDYDSYVSNTYEALANKVVTIDSQSTDDEYPSAKCVFDNFALKEDVANKVTTISSASTDTQYPSALAVYTAIQNALVVDTEEVIP